jgi:dolichol-phosphate mannosyltransferase
VEEVTSSLLLLIPAYNEEDRIGPVLREFGAYLRSHYRGKFQIVVVLNGCRDNTAGVVSAISKEFPEITYIDFPAPIGKGGALIEGLRLAPLVDLIGYVDADGATSPASFLEIVAKCHGEIDCVIGSRWLPGAVLHAKQPWFRQLTSRVFHLIVESLFWMHILDTQCPAKVMKREAIEKTHHGLRIADLAFDVNLLYLLKREKFKILEQPTEWTDKAGSKVTSSLFRVSFVMFLSVVRLRLIYSPFRNLLKLFRPLETWVYKRLKQPAPLLSRPKDSTPTPPGSTISS